ncbi:MAG: tRNA (cytidine(34)-2'-O)-methyltransferase [Clostridiaceae bacterium]|jgi:tRNA (cytidine/uridine-2'-O-)-methyltransferase|nr:tRNA (cytidine(34)-2'-O)-methyltransferase [Clostridiaceae bacterium]
MAVHVVLFEPEIPHNTGNIIRTCVATGTELHIIEPIGFDLYKKNIGRYSSNHMENARVSVYPNYSDFASENKGVFFFLTRYGKQPPSAIRFSEIAEDIYLIFGKESTGLPYALLKKHPERCFRIPMAEEARSLNLSNSVAIVLYEVMRQLDYPGLSFHEVQKGEDYLESFDL